MSGGFDSLGLMPELVQAIDELGWLLPTDIQDEAIPLIMGGGDVMAAAETGSGKTAAFALPIIQCVHERIKNLSVNTSSSISISESGAGMRPNKITKKGGVPIQLSLTDKDPGLDIDDSGLCCDSASVEGWVGARGTHGVRSGKYFYECIVSSNGICRVGWSTIAAHLELGKDTHGFGYGGTGWISNDGKFEKYGERFQNRDAIGCYIDLLGRSISFSRNGKMLGKAFDLPPSTAGSVFFPAVLIQRSEMVVNFGQHPFKFPPKEVGYRALSEASADSIFRSDASEVYANNTGVRKPLALIIEPTRDLAEQVYQAIADFTRHVNDPVLQCALAIGGEDSGGKGGSHSSPSASASASSCFAPTAKAVRIEKRLQQQGVDILIGTIGKLTGLVKTKALDLSQIRFFVLDEADRLLSTDNIESVLALFKLCPGGGAGLHRLQTCFFSATLHSPQIKQLADSICINPTWVDLKGCDYVPDTVHHVVYRVDPKRDENFLKTAQRPAVTDAVHVPEDFVDNSKSKYGSKNLQSQRIKEIKQHMLVKLIDKHNMSQCLVFCRTNVDCTNLETYLCSLDGSHGGGVGGHHGGRKFSGMMDTGKESKYSCCVLAGMRSMEERRLNLQAFKEGYVRILICTDVASRGIDVQGLPFVVNLTLPDEAEDYIHRVGRVGRADRMGLALSLVAADEIQEKVWYHTCSNRGKNCSCRQLKEHGGCTIWYDEPLYLSKIEQLLKQPIALLNADLGLPAEISAQNITYGEDSKLEDSSANVHIEQLAPSLRALATMEIQSQNIFLRFQSTYFT